jgi:cardiolipin synthase
MPRRTLSILVICTVVLFCMLQIFHELQHPLQKNGLVNTTRSQTAAVVDAADILHGRYTVVPQQNLILFTEPSDSDGPASEVLAEIKDASTSIDLVIYELEDKQVERARAEASAPGVRVRVLLNEGLYGVSSHGSGSSANSQAYTYLQLHNVPVEWAPPYFALTHQKTLVVDGKEALIMTFNLTPEYYASSRDFAVLDTDARDVNAIESAFSNDWSGSGGARGSDGPQDGTQISPQSSVQTSSQTSSHNGAQIADDLVWSPGSKTALLSMINASQKSLLIYNEEMADPDVIAALAAAAGRGVLVRVVMTDNVDWHDAFATLASAGVQVRTYSLKAPLYIHAKMVLSDGTQAFIGSENFSTNSLNYNRELGLFISNHLILSQLETIFDFDFQNATPFMTSS